MSLEKNENIYPIYDKLQSRSARENQLGQKAMVVWMTGLSGSGKSTIAQLVQAKLAAKGKLVYVLDGDNIRSGLNQDLGFSLEDRNENIRRISEVAKLMVDVGVICLCSFVSPTNAIRSQAKAIIGEDDFKLVYINTSLEECEKRDVKGLYKKTRKGEIKGFTGIDSPFEAPDSPDLDLPTLNKSPEESADYLAQFIEKQG